MRAGADVPGEGELENSGGHPPARSARGEGEAHPAWPGQGERERSHLLDSRYRLIAPLGEGGMGTVYEAEHVFTGRRVAVKLLLPEAAQDPDLVRRFHIEARTAARVAHPHCVDILDMGQAPDGTLYLVQELLIGLDLRRYLLQTGRLSPAESLEIALPIVEVLGAAHAQGVVHRDVKPSNIFLVSSRQRTWVPKLIDFGTAKMITHGVAAPRLTRGGHTIGTPSHMAPEQLRAERDLDGRTDVWAMGVVLYEMLTGQRPFEATSQHLLSVQILTRPATRIETHCPELPPALVAVIHHALERDRAARLASMEALREALLAAAAASGTTLRVAHMPADAEKLPGHSGTFTTCRADTRSTGRLVAATVKSVVSPHRPVAAVSTTAEAAQHEAVVASSGDTAGSALAQQPGDRSGSAVLQHPEAAASQAGQRSDV